MASSNKNGRHITDRQLITVFNGIDSRLGKLEVLPGQFQHLTGQVQQLNGQVQLLHKQMGLVVDRLIQEVVRSRTFDAAVVNGNIFAIGGYGSPGQNENEVYTPPIP